MRKQSRRTKAQFYSITDSHSPLVKIDPHNQQYTHSRSTPYDKA